MSRPVSLATFITKAMAVLYLPPVLNIAKFQEILHFEPVLQLECCIAAISRKFSITLAQIRWNATPEDTRSADPDADFVISMPFNRNQMV